MPVVTFARFAKELLLLYRPPSRKKATYYKMAQALRELSEVPGVLRTSDLTPVMIVKWLENHTDRAAISNFSVLSSIRSACTYAVKRKYLESSPWEFRTDWIAEDLPDDDEDQNDVVDSVRHHSILEIRRVLSQAKKEAAKGVWAKERLHVLISVYAYTGMRKNEALGLRVSDIDFPNAIIRIRSRKSRSLKTRRSAAPIGIPPELTPILKRWINDLCDSPWLFPKIRCDGPWLSGGPGYRALDQVKAVGERAGVDGLTIQSFRHSLATHMVAWGCGEAAIKDQLRHTNLKTQKYYREADIDNIRSTAAVIHFGT